MMEATPPNGSDNEANSSEAEANEGLALALENGEESPKSFIYNCVPKRAPQEESAHSTWLLTFTDSMALMLTFFVLMFAMSEPEPTFWTDIATSLKPVEQAIPDVDLRQQGPINSFTLESYDEQRAYDLDYVEGVLIEAFTKNEMLSRAMIENTNYAVIISLPQEFLFEPGSDILKESVKNFLSELVTKLKAIKNNVAIHGYTDPSPILNSSKFDSNWSLSLGRSFAMAEAFKSLGYDKNIAIRGFAAGQYGFIPQNMGQDLRYALSRRVDILILDSQGTALDPL